MTVDVQFVPVHNRPINPVADRRPAKMISHLPPDRMLLVPIPVYENLPTFLALCPPPAIPHLFLLQQIWGRVRGFHRVPYRTLVSRPSRVVSTPITLRPAYNLLKSTPIVKYYFRPIVCTPCNKIYLDIPLKLA